MVVMGKFSYFLNDSAGIAQALEHSTDVGSRLHGDNAELVFLINPDEEGLGLVVENTTTLGPVAV
jgi:hypothetical protein